MRIHTYLISAKDYQPSKQGSRAEHVMKPPPTGPENPRITDQMLQLNKIGLGDTVTELLGTHVRVAFS